MTYEYVCVNCGHEWEAEQSMKDSPLKRCPSCKKMKAKRLVSGGMGFKLLGGGWAEDGYSNCPKSSKSSSRKKGSQKSKGS